MNFRFILSIILFSLLCFSNNAFAEVGNLTNAQMKVLMEQNVPIIDIRRQDEWHSTGIIKGSHLMTFFDSRGNYNLNKWLAELNKVAGKDDQFILVCRSGNRTGQISQFLDKKLGYKNVYHLEKGIKNWIKIGDKVVSAE